MPEKDYAVLEEMTFFGFIFKLNPSSCLNTNSMQPNISSMLAANTQMSSITYYMCSLEIAHTLFFHYHFYIIFSPFLIIILLQITGDISGKVQESIESHKEY